MAVLIEDHLPVIKFNGLNTAKAIVSTGTVDFSTATVTLPTAGGAGQVFSETYVGQTTEAATDRAFFIATAACKVMAVSEVHSVAAGGASTLQLVKDTGTTAPGAGTDLLTSTGFDLNATANTVQVGTLVGTAASLALAAGDRLSLDWANTIQSTAGLVITVTLITT